MRADNFRSTFRVHILWWPSSDAHLVASKFATRWGDTHLPRPLDALPDAEVAEEPDDGEGHGELPDDAS